MIALIFWGIVTLLRPNTGFGPIIITGLYALVPAIYLSHLLSRSGFTFPGVQTVLLLIFWVIGLAVVFVNITFFSEERPLRLFTALLGLPMLFLLILDLFWQFPSPYDLISLWGVTVLSVLVLAGVCLFFRFQDQKSLPPSSPAP
jgi:predicted membrane channel-forming protein YqfA (hemolysin III family)